MASTNAIVSQPINMEDIDNVGLETDWTGTPTGTFSLEASNQYDPETNPNATFKAVTLASAPANPAGSASGWLLDLNQIPFRWVRLRYTNASGTGTLQSYAFRRSIGS
jgi:hypothetical protein